MEMAKKAIWYSAGIMSALVLAMSGCTTVAKDFTARTVASASKDGFAYDSTKNQENLKASGEIDPVNGVMKFSVETTATTPESAIAAQAAAHAQSLELISKLLDKVLAGAGGIPK